MLFDDRKRLLRQLKERNEGLLRLESDIATMKNLFERVFMLTMEGGEKIDNIRYNVDETAKKVGKTITVTKKLEDIRAKRRRVSIHVETALRRQ